MTDDARVTRPMRATVLWAFAAVGVLLALAIVALIFLIVSLRRAEAEQACRDRITFNAAGLRDAQGTALADGLATTAIEGRRGDTAAIAQDIRDLGVELRRASELRERAGAICSENPDFTPPS